MTGIIGNAKIITFRTTRQDSAYATPLNAIATGISTGHAALLLTFTDRELFNKYIANNQKIPHAIKINPQTQQEYYEVYVSFWPQKDAGFYSTASTLRTHRFDAELSANNSPFAYAEQWLMNAQPASPIVPELTTEQLAKLIEPLVLEAQELRRVRDLLVQSQQKAPLTLEPLQKIVIPRIPLLRDYAKSTITLGPVIIVHTSTLSSSFGAEVTAAMETYAQDYRAWRELEVQVQNYAAIKQDDLFTQQYTQIANVYKLRMQISEYNLKFKMFPTESLSHAQFMQKLEPYVTFGNTERDAVEIPIVRNFAAGQSVGLELEPMLQYVCTIANNPETYQYHVLKLNCAAVAYNTLWAGAKKSPDTQLRQYLALAWYVNFLGLTITPTMLIQNAARAEHAMQAIAAQALRFSETVREADVPRTFRTMLADMYRGLESYTRS